MYLRMTRRRNADGSEARYYQLAENVWDAAKGCAVAKVIYNFGRAEQLDADAVPLHAHRQSRCTFRGTEDDRAHGGNRAEHGVVAVGA